MNKITSDVDLDSPLLTQAKLLKVTYSKIIKNTTLNKQFITIQHYFAKHFVF